MRHLAQHGSWAISCSRCPDRSLWPRKAASDGWVRVNYAATVSITSYETMGWLRTAVGIALIVAPGAPTRLSGRQEPTGADLLLMRTIGIRDLVLGVGTVAAARSNDVRDIRRWTTTALASDSLDSAASLASFRSIGKRTPSVQPYWRLPSSAETFVHVGVFLLRLSNAEIRVL